VTTIAGNPGTCRQSPTFSDGSGTSALFNQPVGIAYDPSNGDLYVTDSKNCAIRQVTVAGAVTTIAGNPGTCGFSNGSGTSALFNVPEGLTYDSSNGNLYVVDSGNCAIRQVTIAGAVTTIAGNPSTCDQSPTFSNGSGTSALFFAPEFIAYDSANDELYLTDTGNDVIRQIKP
jgi:DNA-binding beta-propeller fold protein YncE